MKASIRDCAGSVLCVPVCAGSVCILHVPFGTVGIIGETPIYT